MTVRFLLTALAICIGGAAALYVLMEADYRLEKGAKRERHPQ